MYRDDLTLLQRWRLQRDAEAFDVLVTRHAGMVHAACKRILRDSSDAEDVTQECFLKLAQSGDRVTTSLGGWLHRVATRQALNRLKQDQRRSIRERTFAKQVQRAETATWDDVQSYVDEALEQLPEPTRDLVIAHFLNRQTHEAIAAELGIPRRTISHRIERGVAAIREHLESRGVRIGTVALAGALAANAAEAAPPPLIAALGRLAIAGVAPPAEATTANLLGGALVMNAKLVGLIVGIIAITGIGLLGFLPLNHDSPPTPIAEVEITNSAPEEAASEAEVDTTPVDATAIDETLRDEIVAQEPTAPGWIADPNDSISVSGFVLDENGAAIPDAVVEANAIGYGKPEDIADDWNSVLFGRTDPGHRHETRSNRKGEFSIDGIRHTGYIMLSASQEGYWFAPTDAAMLRLEPGSNERGILIELRRGGRTLKGQVVEQGSGQPVTDANVIVLNSWQPAAPTDDRGMFSMVFDKANLIPLQVVSRTLGRTTFTEVYTGAVERVTLEIPKPAMVTGLITERGSPATNVQIVLEGKWIRREYATENAVRGGAEGKGFSYRTTANQQGIYRIAGVDTGQEYTIFLLDAGSMPVSSREPLGVLLPGSETIWNYDLRNLVTVHGIVFGSDTRQPLQDVYVSALQDGLPVAGVETQVDSDGSYQLRLPPEEGGYRIFPKYLHSDDTTMASTYGEDLYLQPGDTEQVDLSLLDPWIITARVVDSEGKPIRTDSIIVSDSNQGTQVSRPSDRDGLITWAGAEPGRETWITVTTIGYTIARALAAEYSGKPGSVYHAGDLVVYRTTAGIEGFVSTAAGEPLADTSLRIVAHYGPDELTHLFHSTRTNDQGRFIIMDGVPAAPTYFSLQTESGEVRIAGETDYFSIANEAVTDIGQVVLQ